MFGKKKEMGAFTPEVNRWQSSLCEEMGSWEGMWKKRCRGKWGLGAVVINCDWAVEKGCGGCNDVVRYCDISVGVERGVESGEDGSGDYLRSLVIVFENGRASVSGG